MSNFVRKSIEQKLNKNNYVSRIEKLERLKTAKPSSQVEQIAELSPNKDAGELRTGSLSTRLDGVLTLWNLNEPQYFGGTPTYSHAVPPNALLEDNHIVIEVTGTVFNATGSNRNLAPHLYLGKLNDELPVGSEGTLAIASSSSVRRFTYTAKIRQAQWWGTWVQVDEKMVVDGVATAFDGRYETDLSGGIGIIESLDEVDNLFFYMLASGTLTEVRPFIETIKIDFRDGTTNKEQVHWSSRQNVDHVDDTYIVSNLATTNFGNDTTVYVGEHNGAVSTRRALVKFLDLPNIPPNQYVVDDAYIYVNLNFDFSSNARTCEVYPLARAFVEGDGTAASGATWNTYDGANNWSTAGAGDSTNDYDGTTLVSSLSFSASETMGLIKLFTLDTDYIQDLIDDVRTDYGLLMKMQTELNDMYGFKSGDHGDIGHIPQLHLILRKL